MALSDRTERQHATVTLMIEIGRGMAAQTQRIARRDVVEVGDVQLTDDEDARLAEALRHIETAASDLQRLRSRPRGSFIVGFWAHVFGVLRLASVFGLVRALSGLAPNSKIREAIASHTFVDAWALGHLCLALLATLTASRAGGSVIVTSLAVYGLLRTFELVIYQINLLLFDEHRSAGAGRHYTIKSYRRTVVLLLQNFVEIILWFAVSYAVFWADVRVADVSTLGLIRDSFIATASFGSSAPSYLGQSAGVIVFWQGVVGLFMTLLSLARFVGLLPPPVEASY